MHTLYQAAIRWETVERNPIDLVRQSSKRLKTPRILTPADFKALLAQLGEPYKTMALVIACLGLRVCELLGLQWGDFDFENLTVRIQRSVNEGEVNSTKTEASEGLLPLTPELAETIRAHRVNCHFLEDSAFVFASSSGKARWPDNILADYLKPAAEWAGIGNVGWHPFRHTFSTLLDALGATPAVQKELMRHSDIQTTINLYAQALLFREAKRSFEGRTNFVENVRASGPCRSLCFVSRPLQPLSTLELWRGRRDSNPRPLA